jgi:NAD(P)-dependent dehydrogenase (short-subunit alcohol dehydrogenase family)
VNGRRAIVTGAARGIGRATALALARDGDDVAILDLDADGAERAAAECRAFGCHAVGLKCDVASEVEVEAAFAKAGERLGGLDILVCTAAWLDPTGPVHEMPAEVWDRAIAADLRTVFLSCRAAIRMMIAGGRGGRIVNLSSLAGRQGRANRASYGAAKAGILNLTESLALEVDRYGITVNAVCPGAVAGARARDYMRSVALKEGLTGEQADARFAEQSRSMPTEDEVAAVVLFLCSPAARRITGQNIGIGAMT